MRLLIATGVALLMATLVSPAQAGTSIKPGQWKITSKVVMPGMPMTMPNHTITQCLGDKQVRSAREAIQRTSKKDCKVSDINTSGNKTTWKVHCSGEHAASGSGTYIIHSPTSYSTIMDMSMNAGGQTMSTHIETEGTWVGKCPAK